MVGTYTIFVLPHHIVKFGRRSRIWWVLEKELLPIRCLFMEWKFGRNSIFNLLHIPYNSTKNACFFIIALAKVIIFSRWKKNTGMRLIVKYLLPCSTMFYMPFINSVKFIFATKEMSYESGRCKGVVLP